MSFTEKDVRDAYAAICPYVETTPLLKSYYLGSLNQNVYFKLESMQVAKSFKIRGALNKMLSLNKEQIEKGVATISSGNHGSSVSYAASLLGIKNTVVIVPKNTPKSKIDKIKYFGSDVMLMGENYDEAHNEGMAYIQKTGKTYIDAYYDDVKIYAGQGTIGLEILKQNPNIDTLVVPIGGGGLITGIAVYVKSVNPNIKIIGVQTKACPAMYASLKEHIHYKEYPSDSSICDALIGGVGALSYKLLPDYIDDIALVSEKSIADAVAFMALDEKIVAEPGSCTTIAALKEYPEKFTGKNIALVISGGNIDGALLKQLINQYDQKENQL